MAVVIRGFVDAGASAKSADRPDLMRMIQYVKTNKVAYCIVHKVDRLARNRADGVTIHLALQQATEKEVEAAAERAMERVLARRPSGPEGSREYRLRYHDRNSQLLYAAIAGLEIPLVRAEVHALAERHAGRPLDETEIARQLAALIRPALTDALTEAVADHPGIDPDAVAHATVASIGRHLTDTQED